MKFNIAISGLIHMDSLFYINIKTFSGLDEIEFGLFKVIVFGSTLYSVKISQIDRLSFKKIHSKSSVVHHGQFGLYCDRFGLHVTKTVYLINRMIA